MRALSLWQPWAWAVLHAGKKIENRTAWKHAPRWRGEFLIHAAIGYGTRDDFDEAVEMILEVAKPAAGPERLKFLSTLAQMQIGGRGRHHASGLWVPRPELPRGALVGRARLDGVIRNEAEFAAYAANTPDGEAQRPWWLGGFALLLADVQALDKPIPWKGKQGWFDVPDSALAGDAR